VASILHIAGITVQKNKDQGTKLAKLSGARSTVKEDSYEDRFIRIPRFDRSKCDFIRIIYYGIMYVPEFAIISWIAYIA